MSPYIGITEGVERRAHEFALQAALQTKAFLKTPDGIEKVAIRLPPVTT